MPLYVKIILIIIGLILFAFGVLIACVGPCVPGNSSREGTIMLIGSFLAIAGGTLIAFAAFKN